MKKLSWSFLSLVLVGMIGNAYGAVNHKIWDGILKANVDNEGYVDYPGIRINRGGDLYQYITSLETVDVKTLNEQERLAFWINAYNAHMVKLILAKPKLEKIDEDLGMFDKKFKIAKYDLSLNTIEHRILRSDLEKGGPIKALSLPEVDPRIHFALVCGAIDCPKLSNRAFFPTEMDERLQESAEYFASNSKYIRIENGKLVMSSVLKWYAKDFEKVGGVAPFLSSFLDGQVRSDAEEIKNLLLTDFPANVDFRYDWTLNHIRNKKK